MIAPYFAFKLSLHLMLQVYIDIYFLNLKIENHAKVILINVLFFV